MRDWRDEETWEPGISIELAPGRPAADRPDREASGRLLDELMAVPSGERLDRLAEEERFQSPGLFDLLLEQGHSALPQDALRAAELLEVAVELGAMLDGREDFDGEAESEGLARGLCLLGTAGRLRGEQGQAELTLVRAGRYAFKPLARGFFARALGLLRWDQGRSEEAAGLLHHAVRRFGEAGARREVGACHALLGLLALEEEESSTSAVHLRQARRALEAGLNPWLAAQATLAWALYLARAGETGKAKAVRKEAWSCYGEVKSEDALVSVYWLEGRVAVAVGDLDDGVGLLDSVRRKQIQAGWLMEATLASVDLGLAKARQGRAEELKTLMDDLASFQESPGYSTARRTLGIFADDAMARRLDLEIWSASSPSLRLAFRLAGIRPRPVPFA
ncbi:MAG: hypothetical protein ACJ75H_09900 [Thermoanaerobaculia bacterium]